ncbi:anti-sigma factor [Salinisphaera sp. T31B1]|uniref:anti-sigma factor n=1 Tax=Salinisphaera sp. T31B1 TaxID=727963 RepID=UPI00333EFAB8
MADLEQPPLTIRAAEYVLGTLTSDERARFEQELADSESARAELAYWEQRLGAIGLALSPVEPPAQVWQGIRQRIHASAVNEPVVTPSTAPPERSSRGGNGWRNLAVAASVAALVMAGMLFIGSTRAPGDDADAAPAYASMVYDAPTGTSWLVTAHDGSHEMSVTALASYDVPDGKVLQAWLVPADGQPMRLGEWPHTQGRHQMPVSDAAVRYMKKRATLMVSMEDAANVADLDAPAGKLMWTSPIARRTS